MGVGIALGIGAAAAAGYGAAGAAGAFDPAKPQDRNIANEKTLNFWSDYMLADPILAAERQYRPQYNALNSDLFYSNLFGSKARSYTEQQTLTPEETIDFFNKKYGTKLDPTPTNIANVMTILGGPQTKNVTRNVAGQKGLLDIYGEAAPRIGKIGRDSALYDADTRLQVGNKIMAGLKASDPRKTNLLDLLTDDAESELRAGSSLSPAMRREVASNVRAGQAARGVGSGPSDIYEEAMTLGSAGQNLLDRRRNYAASVYGLRDQEDQTLQDIITGNNVNSLGLTGSFLQGAQGMSAGSGPQLFAPYSAYSDSVFGGNTNAQNQYNVDVANTRNAAVGGAVSSLGSLAGSYIGYRGNTGRAPSVSSNRSPYVGDVNQNPYYGGLV